MRTEKEVLKDFEKLGYKTFDYRAKTGCLILRKFITWNDEKIVYTFTFDNDIKSIEKTTSFKYREVIILTSIDYEEICLIHELFEIWGWL